MLIIRLKLRNMIKPKVANRTYSRQHGIRQNGFRLLSITMPCSDFSILKVYCGTSELCCLIFFDKMDYAGGMLKKKWNVWTSSKPWLTFGVLVPTGQQTLA